MDRKTRQAIEDGVVVALLTLLEVALGVGLLAGGWALFATPFGLPLLTPLQALGLVLLAWAAHTVWRLFHAKKGD